MIFYETGFVLRLLLHVDNTRAGMGPSQSRDLTGPCLRLFLYAMNKLYKTRII